MAEPIYRRVLVKVSGEALMGPGDFGIYQLTLQRIADDLVATQAIGVELGVVVGGGNIFRGMTVSQQGIPRVTGDMMGILATVMNALALESALEKTGVAARTMSALAMPEICETYERRRAHAISPSAGWCCLPPGPEIRSSPPTPPPCCAPPKSARKRDSRQPTSTVSTVQTPRRIARPTLRAVDASGGDRAPA